MIKDGMYVGAKVKPTPNKGGYIKPRLIIVHDTAGALNSAGSVAWLCNPAAKASAHFVIGRDGDITQLASCNVKTWHAGVSSYEGVKNVNDFSIGIELVNPGIMQAHGAASARASFGTVFSRSTYGIEELPAQQNLVDTMREPITTHPAGLWMPYPQKQLDALLAVALAIKEAYGITAVAPHWFISPRRKVDTNPLFPLRWLEGKLAGRQTADDVVADLPAPAVVEDVVTDPSLPKRIRIKRSGALRAWPSMHNNILFMGAEQDDAEWEVINLGQYYLEGMDIPPDFGEIQLPWYRVKVPTSLHQDGRAFVLESATEIVV